MAKFAYFWNIQTYDLNMRTNEYTYLVGNLKNGIVFYQSVFFTSYEFIFALVFNKTNVITKLIDILILLTYPYS